jgi:hypothetical protein
MHSTVAVVTITLAQIISSMKMVEFISFLAKNTLDSFSGFSFFLEASVLQLIYS